MDEDKPIICPICNQTMLPVDLHQVPADTIKDFVSVPENQLEDNWYWCSDCDTYDQAKTPIKLSPEIERLRRMIEWFSII